MRGREGGNKETDKARKNGGREEGRPAGAKEGRTDGKKKKE